MKHSNFIAIGVLLLISTQLSAGTLLIDRGLPTGNLNNSAGVDRSNVAWAFGIDANGSWLVGDSFTNASASAYYIDSIRVWTVGETNNPALWGGFAGSSFTKLASIPVITPVVYQGGVAYQGSHGDMIGIHQLDFDVNITLGVGQTYDFFLDGGRPDFPFIPFLHASNAALSGSRQDGADDTMYYLLLKNGTPVPGESGEWSSYGYGWDKPSDVNVQVFGTVPDGFSTVLLVGFALTGLSALKWRKNN